MEENINTIDEITVESSDDVLEGNTVEDTTCVICETIDYTDQLNSINNGVQLISVFVVLYVSLYLFNYILNKFVIKKEG